jgi:hypothetical protein
VRGIAVHVAARVAALAQPGECLVTRTVKDLVAGADIRFSERGKRDLKGITELSNICCCAQQMMAEFSMSALGQKQTFAPQKIMSALPPKADMCSALAHVCFGPIADIEIFTSVEGVIRPHAAKSP